MSTSKSKVNTISKGDNGSSEYFLARVFALLGSFGTSNLGHDKLAKLAVARALIGHAMDAVSAEVGYSNGNGPAYRYASTARGSLGYVGHMTGDYVDADLPKSRKAVSEATDALMDREQTALRTVHMLDGKLGMALMDGMVELSEAHEEE